MQFDHESLELLVRVAVALGLGEEFVAGQADAIAAQLAAWAGADVTFRPEPAVLRAQLFTGTDDLFLRRTVGEEDGEAAATPPWEPPAKVVGRYLGPYLAGRGIVSEREGPSGPAVP